MKHFYDLFDMKQAVKDALSNKDKSRMERVKEIRDEHLVSLPAAIQAVNMADHLLEMPDQDKFPPIDVISDEWCENLFELQSRLWDLSNVANTLAPQRVSQLLPPLRQAMVLIKSWENNTNYIK